RRRPEAATNNGRRRQAVPRHIDARRRPEPAVENAGRRAEAATNNGRRQAEAAHPHKDARRRPGADINSRRRLVAIVDGVGQLVGWRLGKWNRWRCRTMSTSWPSSFTSNKDCWSASVDSKPTSLPDFWWALED
ncbi:unnamed protein product, partial [Callosobruchus maculatus]